MSDWVIRTADIGMFDAAFGPAIAVGSLQDPIEGSGEAKIQGKKICVVGDEDTVIALGHTYTSGVFTVPGTCHLIIQALSPDQRAIKTSDNNGTKVILKGGNFIAKLVVDGPAINPVPSTPVPDPTPFYTGTGHFITTNTKVKGT